MITKSLPSLQLIKPKTRNILYNLDIKMSNNYQKIGQGKNIIFLHGWKADKNTWNTVADCLKDDFTCWLIDLPGFGNTPKLDSVLSPLDYAVWVKDFAKKMKIEKYFLVGHSFGGRISICLAAGDDEPQKLVLYGTPSFPENLPLIKKIMLFFYQYLGLKKLKFLQNNLFFKKIQSSLRSHDYQNAHQLKNIFLTSIKFDLKPFLKKISLPTLIVHGDKDQEVALWIAQKTNNTVKNSQLKIVDGTHFFHLENPLLFAGYLRKFFNE